MCPRSHPGVIVLGAGDHARVVASVLEAAGVDVAAHYDDDPARWGATIGRACVLGPLAEAPRGAPAVIAIGDNRTRADIAQRLEHDWVQAVHPFSWLDPGVTLGPGAVVCAGVTVGVGARVGAHVILNNRSGVGHDADVGDFAHISVAHLGSGARLGVGGLLGVGSVVLPRVTVGDWATVGAGAVVTVDVGPGVTVVGNPAREVSGAPHTRQAAGGARGKVSS